jgi:hypothetical protein
MALPPLAPVSAMETRLGLAAGALSGADLARAGDALADASTLVRLYSGKDWTPELCPAALVTVTVQAALRAYRNPEGYTGENFGGAYAYTTKETGVGLTADEVATCERVGKATRTLYSHFNSVRVRSAYQGHIFPPPIDYWAVEF